MSVDRIRKHFGRESRADWPLQSDLGNVFKAAQKWNSLVTSMLFLLILISLIKYPFIKYKPNKLIIITESNVLV